MSLISFHLFIGYAAAILSPTRQGNEDKYNQQSIHQDQDHASSKPLKEPPTKSGVEVSSKPFLFISQTFARAGIKRMIPQVKRCNNLVCMYNI
jgi:hypothetical protein